VVSILRYRLFFSSLSFSLSTYLFFSFALFFLGCWATALLLLFSWAHYFLAFLTFELVVPFPVSAMTV